MNTYAVETSKVGKMQLLILLNRFEREEGESALPLGVLVDYNVLHPTVWCATVILRGSSEHERESERKSKPRTE